MLKKIILRFKMFFLNFWYAFQSLFYKKDEKSVLFGSWFGEKFADNTRYLFQYMADHKQELGLHHVGWVTRSEKVFNQLKSMGYEVYMMGTPESAAFHKKAGYHIICDSSDAFNPTVKTDIETKYSWRAKRINMWHGVIGFKGVGYASADYALRKKRHPFAYRINELLHKSSLYRRFFESAGGWGDCVFLSTTEDAADRLKKYFALPDDHFILTAFARVCGVNNLLPDEQEIVDKIKSHRQCILYFPTFRGASSTFDANQTSVLLEEYLNSHDVLFIQKFHSAGANRNAGMIERGNIITLPHDFDINTIIPYASLLITDYSSVMGDAMYYDVPLLYYTPDIVEYTSKDRGFVINPQDIMCGPQVSDSSALTGSVACILESTYEPDERYQAIKAEYYRDDKEMGDIWTDIVLGTGPKEPSQEEWEDSLW